MLAKYHRWVFETKTPESVIALKTWVFEESEFQTIAAETVQGVTGTTGSICNQSSADSTTWNSQKTFFGEMIDHCSIKNSSCQVCGRDHKIWTCQKFMKNECIGTMGYCKKFQIVFPLFRRWTHWEGMSKKSAMWAKWMPKITPCALT